MKLYLVILLVAAFLLAPALAQCSVADIRLEPVTPTATCGTRFQALLRSVNPSAACPLSSGGMLVCDAAHQNCIQCTTSTAAPGGGILFSCLPTQANGAQDLTAVFQYGTVTNTIHATIQVSGCTPPPTSSCNVADLRFAVLGSQPKQCGLPFQAQLSTVNLNPACPLSSGGMLICDANHLNCLTCTTSVTTSSSVIFTCNPNNFNGVQELTAVFAYGSISSTIVTTMTVTGCGVACNSADIRFEVTSPGTRPCNTPFTATLRSVNPSPSCPLSSGGMLVCDDQRRNCAQCTNIATSPTGVLTYTCSPINFNGVQQLTAVYQYGPLIGTIAGVVPVSGCTIVCNPSLAVLPGPHTCGGTPVDVRLSFGSTSSSCAARTDGLLLCDALWRECVDCTTVVSNDATGTTFRCSSLQYDGTQVFTSVITSGAGLTTVQASAAFTGCSTAPSFEPLPPFPIPPPNPLDDCSHAGIRLEAMPGPHVCGGQFYTFLTDIGPQPRCPLSTVGMTICDPTRRRDCFFCDDFQTTPHGIVYTCDATAVPGLQSLAASYALGIEDRTAFDDLLVTY